MINEETMSRLYQQATSIRIQVPAEQYCGETEDCPKNLPGLDKWGKMWSAVIDLKTGRVRGWPAGRTGLAAFKVVDRGCYTLEDAEGCPLARLECEYAPTKLLTMEPDNDYITLQINDRGFVCQWPRSPCLDDFEKGKLPDEE